MSLLFLVATAALFGRGEGHEIVSFVVPTIADPRDNAILSCRYDMGDDQLYSVKWFKNEQELFRFMPAQRPPGLAFPVLGIQLSHQPSCSRISCDLELTNLTLNSAGLYRCEVSIEAPTFRIAYQSGNMTVAALPRRDPLVEGAATSYALGEDIRVNCTSDPSLPAAEVTWYINDIQASFPYLEGAFEAPADSEGLSTRSLGLRLKAEKALFTSRTAIGAGQLKLRCVSAMPVWLPGGPHRRQFTIIASLRSPSQTDNQRLEWMDGGCRKTSEGTVFLMLSALVVRMTN